VATGVNFIKVVYSFICLFSEMKTTVVPYKLLKAASLIVRLSALIRYILSGAWEFSLFKPAGTVGLGSCLNDEPYYSGRDVD